MHQPPYFDPSQQPPWQQPPTQYPPFQAPQYPSYQQPTYYPPQPTYFQPPSYPQQLPLDWLEMERRRAVAAKSYTNKAMITLLLYMLFFVPGLIANLLYLAEANETRELTGRNPDGWGCLWTMLIVAVSPVLLICLLMALGAGHH